MLMIICGQTAANSHAADDIDFSRDVLPILSENCFACHGPDENHRAADLRLDERAGAMTVISPGNPEQSELLRRIRTLDPDQQMPPADSNRKLSPQQMDRIEQWIRDGAAWEQHWSFQPLTARPVPAPAFPDVPVHNAIDLFVQQRLHSEQMRPSVEAERRILIRRVTLDLTGLPPTVEETEHFVADPRPDAYEQLVDRLLASPSYGERMAWDWLDAARYADSNGYQGDGERTMWPWRDWVVDAMNRNVPFDQFTVWQLAGDLLPDATDEQRLATGFCRNHMINGEGGRIAEENRVDYVMDMTETMGTVWLGLTLNCCRCHDHKFDPLTNRNYYELFAFFNQTPVSGGGGNPQTPPVMSVLTTPQQQELKQLAEKRRAVQASLEERVKSLLPRQMEWEADQLRNQRSGIWTFPPVTRATAQHQQLAIQSGGIVLASGPNPVNDTYTVRLSLPPMTVSAVRLDALRHPSMTAGGLARSDSGNFVLTELEVSLVDGEGNRTPLTIDSAVATFEQGDLKVSKAFDGIPSTGWAVYEGHPVDRDHSAVFYLRSPKAVTEGTSLEVILRHDSPHASHNLGHFRMAVSSFADAELPQSVTSLTDDLLVAAEQRSEEQRKRIRQAFLDSDPEHRGLQAEQKQLEKSEQDLRGSAPKVMVMEDRGEWRRTFVLSRGLYNQPTEAEVDAALPVSLPQWESTAPGSHLSRLDLARWLVSPENPLTARVTVNRFWQQFFGLGLVRTTEDFGVQGEYPVQRELLDWLAADFRDHGWDVKRLIRTIVTSHTYRQSSSNRPTQRIDADKTVMLYDADPENRLLARASRFRLPSWMLRDQALAVSGLLNPRIGGPAVNSYQPEGVWEEATFGNKKYRQDQGDALYRRSLYIFWRRIIAPTVFFDNASRQTCTVKAVRTNTPLHALLTLNETTYVESARVLAQRLLTDDQHTTDSQRLAFAFQRVLMRDPSESEQQILLAGLKRSIAEYQSHASEAQALLSVGESARDQSVAASEHAAWTSLCLALLNLDETLNRE
ncbi:MAG: PSD1 domain-containing protein [Planctomycetaceae bacterium]|nr:PSD1 domain-containing protein [Planctomycetaceae bacterium]